MSSAGGASVRISGLVKEFQGRHGTLRAIDGVDLVLPPGEFCAVVGPSGCGKTTLLRLLAGLEEASRGEVTLEGMNGRAPSPALVFQGNSLFPWMTVRDNVAYSLWVAGKRRHERQEASARHIEMVGLTAFANAYPNQLSEGMRQRVALARAFCAEPDLLLLDEPFASLDEQNRMLLQEELLRIWQASGKTVLFVTHSIEEALVLSDRVLVMSARPARIKADLRVPFPRPRVAAEIRGKPEFAALVRDIWEILRTEVLRARDSELVRA